MSNLNYYQAEQCMQAFKQTCDQADRSDLISSEDCNYWVFEQGYKAAMQAVANKSNQVNTHGPLDLVSDMLANGFALLEKTKNNSAKVISCSN